MRAEDRERAQIECANRVVDSHMQRASNSPEGYLETLVNDTLYHERRRLEKDSARDPRVKADIVFYQQIQRRLRHASTRDLRQMLDDMARRFSNEVVGSFDERVYRLTTTAVPTGLALLLHALSPENLRSLGSVRRGISDHLEIRGAIDEIKAVQKHGTLIVVPTHSSHMDSIVLGYAVHLLGLPPLLYGAGLNLFNNPLLAFFMSNLGAYRVDRKKQAGLYKDVLKEYASVSLELGYDNLFFPGGTRSRSGAVEQKLKKGLLGAGIRAYVENLRKGRSSPNIYVVPCTISYKLVLEAETLIDDYLKETGKSRYIIEDDEFSRPRRILSFLSSLFSLDGRIVVTFSPPVDLIGNRVDRQGRSLDPKGRVIDVASYVRKGGEAVHDTQRDMEYTRECATAIASAYLQDNVVMSTHVLAYSILSVLRQHNPELDLYRLLRTGGRAPSLEMSTLTSAVESTLQALRKLPTAPTLSSELEQRDMESVIGDGLRYFSTYHQEPAAERQGDRVFHRNRNLLLYYGNRLQGYDLGRHLRISH